MAEVRVNTEKPLPVPRQDEDFMEAPPAYDDIVTFVEGSSHATSDVPQVQEKPQIEELTLKKPRNSIEASAKEPEDDSEDDSTEESSSSSSHQSSESSVNHQPQPQHLPLPLEPLIQKPVENFTLPAFPQTRVSVKTQEEALGTVRDLIRDLLQRDMSLDACYGVVSSCASACQNHRLDFSCILQERTIEGRSAIFWAIITRYGILRKLARDSSHDLIEQTKWYLTWFIGHVSEMTSIGRTEVRIAALVVADNDLLQRVLALPGAIQLSGIERVLLSDLSRAALRKTRKDSDEHLGALDEYQALGRVHSFGDVAIVQESPLDDSKDSGLFNVNLAITMFQRRLRLSREISIEFFARGRLWILVFFVVPSTVQTPNVTESPTPLSPDDPLNSDLRNVPSAAIAAARHHNLAPGTWALSLSLFGESPQCVAEATLSVQTPTQGLVVDQVNNHNLTSNSTGNSSTLPSRRHHRVNSELPRTTRHSLSVPEPVRQRSNENFGQNSRGSQLHPGRPPHSNMSDSNLQRLVNSNHLSSPGTMASRRSMSFFSTSSSGESSPLSILLSGISSDRRPLLTAPAPAFLPLKDPSPILPLDENSKKKKKEKKVRPTKQEKRERKRTAAKERRLADGKETKKDREENEKAANSVLFATINETLVRGTKNGKKKGRKEKETEANKAKPFVYDICSYIGPDGILRADLEVRLYGSELSETKGSDCIIC